MHELRLVLGTKSPNEPFNARLFMEVCCVVARMISAMVQYVIYLFLTGFASFFVGILKLLYRE